MTRRALFSALAGAPLLKAGSSYLLDENGKPREFVNGQCPVCGTMARPYQFDGLQPARRLVRCNVCHGAFFQDQEDETVAKKSGKADQL